MGGRVVVAVMGRDPSEQSEPKIQQYRRRGRCTCDIRKTSGVFETSSFNRVVNLMAKLGLGLIMFRLSYSHGCFDLRQLGRLGKHEVVLLAYPTLQSSLFH